MLNPIGSIRGYWGGLFGWATNTLVLTKKPRPGMVPNGATRVGGRDFCREASKGTVPPGRRGTIPNLNHLQCRARSRTGHDIAPKATSRLTATTAAGEYPKLREHLAAVVTMMQLSDDWHDFIKKLDRLRPRLDIASIKKGQPTTTARTILVLGYERGAAN